VTRAKLRKDAFGLWHWECDCGAKGVSFIWEVAQLMMNEHVAGHGKPKVSRDALTPPGGTHYDWSDTGMHVRIRESE